VGAVSIDIHKHERDFELLSLSDENVVRYLIIHRDKVDAYFGNEQNPHFDTAGDTGAVNQELIGLYASLDTVIKNSKLTDKQKELIHLVSIGYTFMDIAELTGEQATHNVKKKFDSIVKAIVKQNEYEWKVWVHKRFLDTDTKACGKCKSELPMTDFFYSKKNDSKDGLHSYCKRCR
jgi:hypothetical protein